ncbi:adenylate/guanylate cyclase domain-containing protein [Spongiactinospora rosea]|uniref:Adenylate/guanylate cyclase domain-containing protein n=2 Tax=Spongiactinospora rosea TaxID=2248750 RepID=A0A366LVB8_9ACTN|nr:adenylate/guanylate cyclase domain-containing protein [Spongiactinospora rosea]
MLGLWLLLAQDHINIIWQHETSHFWLIILVAGINLALGLLMTRALIRRPDARILLVSLVFLTNAGFFFLHGLSTPKIILPTGSMGFDLDQPVGLTVASVFAFMSALPLDGRAAQAVLAAAPRLRAGLAVLLLAWTAASLLPGLTPLSAPPPPGGATLGVFSLFAVALYGAAAIMMFRLHRRRPAAMLVSLITAYTLLAEAMIAGMSRNNWHLSWWEWHILLTLAFVFVAYSGYLQFRHEGSSAGLFDSIALAATVRRLQAQYAQALEELVDHLRQGSVSRVPVATRLAGKFGLTEAQAAVLDRAGAALANEREISDRLAALVDVGRGARVGRAERELLTASLDRVRQAYGDVRISLVADGTVAMGSADYREADFARATPIRDGQDRLIYPLTVKGRLAGVIRVPVGVTPQDEPLAALLAHQLSIALENDRLYAELSTLFRQYMSPDVASALLADPEQAALGGSLVELTSLFADLKGFTTFSERVSPGEIVEMLNRYHTAAVPCILRNGGTIVQFVGDALLALFNAPARQPDHARAAARAGLAMQRAAERVAAEVLGEQAAGHRNTIEWPKFRVGVNTGPALVGNIGSPELRGFNAMGDCVNVAARLQSLAEPGTVVIGSTTRDLLGESAVTDPLGPLRLKGKEQPVEAFVLRSIAEDPDSGK